MSLLKYGNVRTVIQRRHLLSRSEAIQLALFKQSIKCLFKQSAYSEVFKICMHIIVLGFSFGLAPDPKLAITLELNRS